jgi:transcriptional regulator GlxA family with amidase domain
MARDTSTVAVLLFDRAPLFEQSVPVSIFGVDRTPSGAPPFTMLPVAAEPGPLTTTGGIQLHAPYGLDAIGRAGIVVVPSWRDSRERPPEAPLAALRAAHAGGALIVGLCMGTFVLAASGLLDGRRAATHWFHAPVLAASAKLSRRTFDRRFRAATGMSPLQWLLHQRVLRAQELLEQTGLPVDHIAREVGLGSAVSLRPPFRRLVGVSPQRYRETFRGVLPGHGENVVDQRGGVVGGEVETEDRVVVQRGDDVVDDLARGGGFLTPPGGAGDHLLGLAGAQVPAGAGVDVVAAC